MYEIKKLNVISVARICTFITLVSFLLWAFIWIIFASATSSYFVEYFFQADFDDFTILWVLVGTIASALIGFISGAIGALVYNVISSWIGGIKMEIELLPDEEEEKVNVPEPELEPEPESESEPQVPPQQEPTQVPPPPPPPPNEHAQSSDQNSQYGAPQQYQ